MNGKNNIIIPIFIVLGVIILIIVFAVVFMSSDKKTTTPPPAQKPVATTTQTDIESVTEPGNQTTNPNNDVVMGIYKDSILRSTDNGLNFENYFKITTTTDAQMGLADILNFTFHPETENQIFVSTYDDGLFYNESGVNAWKPINFPPKQIYSFILDRNNPSDRAFASGVVSGNGRLFRTDDKGITWRAVYAEPGLKTYVSALAQNPVNANIILAGTNTGTIVRSIDGGDTWKNIGQSINGLIYDLVYDSSRSSFMYLLIKQGKIYHSTDGGITWLNWEEEKTKEIKALNDLASKRTKAGDKTGAEQAKASAKAITERNKTEKTPSGSLSIVVDPNISGTLYLGTTKGIYRSTDYGKYWKPLNIIESALKFSIPSIAINPDNSNEISFVAGKTFYRSVNAGATWAITPLDNARNASFVAYNPYDTSMIFVGMSSKQ